MSRVFKIGGARSAGINEDLVREVNHQYAVIGYSDEPSALGALISYLTTNSLMTIGGLFLSSADPKELENGEGNWVFDCTYLPFREKAPSPGVETMGEYERNFSFALSNEKIFVPIGVQGVYKRTGEAADAPEIFLIGDQGDGEPPAGVDILAPEISEGEKRYLKQSYWTESVANDFLRLIGKVNTTPFKGWDAGEVLCAGISGAFRGADDIELQFAYRIRQNSTVTVPGFTSFDKLGWQYLWPRHYLEEEATTGKKLVTQKIAYLVLSQVYESTAFTALE